MFGSNLSSIVNLRNEGARRAAVKGKVLEERDDVFDDLIFGM
jgi:hypothetical protein